MKKILIICGRYPLPENTGTSMRTMNFVKYFKTHGSVDIAYSELPPGAIAGNPIFSEEYFLRQKEYPRLFFGRLLAFLRGQPYPVRVYDDDSEKRLLSIIEANGYDYICVRYIDKAYSLFKMPSSQRKRVILDFDDLFSGSLYGSYFRKTSNPYKKMIINWNRRLLMRYENKCLDFGASLFCSAKDCGSTGGGRYNAFIVPNIFSNEEFETHDFGDGFANNNELLFVGTLLYGPNIEGLKWFLGGIYKGIQEKHPDLKLTVVGQSPGEEIGRICRVTEGVGLHANVPDVKEYYQRCKAVVVPLLSGGGTRIKILESALAGRPVLSTPAGAEGLDLRPEKELLLFRNEEEFARRFRQIQDKETYDSLVRNAKEFVMQNYSGKNFNEVMEKVLAAMEKN